MAWWQRALAGEVHESTHIAMLGMHTSSVGRPLEKTSEQGEEIVIET